MDQETFQYLARQYSPLLQSKLSGIHTNRLRSLLDSLNHNAQCAEEVLLSQLAQTWRIVEYAIVQELQAREMEQRQAPEKGPRTVKKKSSLDDPVVEKVRTLDDTRHEKMKTRFFKGVMENEAPKHTLSDIDSASNMTTPLAQPLPDSPPDPYNNSSPQFTSLNEARDIQPLPPSVLSSNQGTMTSNDWSSMSDIDSRPIHPLQHRESNASESNASENMRMPSDSPPTGQRDSIPTEIEEEQRSAPLAIAGRADWHNRGRPRPTKQVSDVDEFDQKMEDKRTAIRDYKIFPKKPLSLESNAGSAKPAFYRHESTESFPMFSASTASSHPSKSPATSFTSGARLYDAHEGLPRNDTMLRTRSDSVITSSSIPEEEFESKESFAESLNGHHHIHLDRPSTPPPLLKESTPLKAASQEDEDVSIRPATNGDTSTPADSGTPNGLPCISIPVLSHQTDTNPWSAEMLLREAIRHYHSSTDVDIQSAAHLLQKLRVLFEDCENVLPREESEAIFKIYNENLIRQSMYIEAAELRLLCEPSYPSVYEYAQGDTYMNVFCFTCKRPYENPKTDNTRCHRCSTPQEPCTICMSLSPPSEWVAEQSELPFDAPFDLDSELSPNFFSPSYTLPKTEPVPSEMGNLDGTPLETYERARPKGTTLWSWCQGCGHGGHLACISTWLKDIDVSEGGCATPGCMHDCAPGPRREQNRRILLEESKKRDTASRKAGVGFVKRDTWAKGESKAVEKVRGMLSVGASAGSASTATTTTTSVAPSATSSNLMSSPKKVRLVTPSEQGKPPRTSSTRTSFG